MSEICRSGFCDLLQQKGAKANNAQERKREKHLRTKGKPKGEKKKELGDEEAKEAGLSTIFGSRAGRGGSSNNSRYR